MCQKCGGDLNKGHCNYCLSCNNRSHAHWCVERRSKKK